MKTLTLCESKADPRWKRTTEGRRPKDRSEKGVHSYLPGWHPKENASQLPEEVLKPAWSASTHSEEKGPEDPGASCKAPRGNRRLQLVQADFPFPWRSLDSVHRQSAELPCCASETWYLQCYCSQVRRDPTDAVLGQVDDICCCSTTGAWSCRRRQLWRFRGCLRSLWRFRRCSSWTNSTRPFCLCSSTKWSMSLLGCGMSVPPVFSGPCRSHARCVQRQMPIVDVLVLVSLRSTGADTT